ncbi:hypothetical protein PPYR_03166 [Photinus pyralis]|uniref:CRAL-TRIO domain-containing protein n=1 Tax=Photinus pyralis TaxID=7054 RepID=A0A5N4A239_PHOPY|nr:hypothetical protein PPYR_03166 [Photinus pyralis]
MKIFDAQDEYTKTKELRLEDVRALQEWVAKQPHMPSISESLLIAFFQSCYWSMEQTKAAIEKFVTWRAAWPDFFANLDLPHLRSAIDQNLATVLPIPSKEGYKLFYHKLMIPDSARYTPAELIKLADMVLVQDVMEKGPYGGLIMVSDLTDYDAAHILKVRVAESRRCLKYLQDAVPLRLKALHCVVSGKVLEILIPLIKPFLNRTLLGKVSTLHVQHHQPISFSYTFTTRTRHYSNVFPRTRFLKKLVGSNPVLRNCTRI